MAIINGGLVAQVMHKRLRPREHRFRYHVYYICFPLSALLKLKSPLFGVERWRPFAFYNKDHGPCDGSALDTWIGTILQKFNIESADGEVVLMTHPRVLGYAFNPVSFWFCLDKSGNLRAVLAEVHNTFGERHCYLIAHEDQRPMTQNDWFTSKKVFHVSPFMEVRGEYRFRFAYGEERVGVWIDYETEEGEMLQTSVAGKREPLTDGFLLKVFFRYPMMTLKVIGLIHFEAIRLLAKKIKYVPKPTPPSDEVTR